MTIWWELKDRRKTKGLADNGNGEGKKKNTPSFHLHLHLQCEFNSKQIMQNRRKNREANVRQRNRWNITLGGVMPGSALKSALAPASSTFPNGSAMRSEAFLRELSGELFEKLFDSVWVGSLFVGRRRKMRI